ncbi:MAG: DNA-packaging protein [Clostridia bacterium]|nr:DNA-packaging protein [Clostridia bacterium]
MLDKVKLALLISGNDFDTELNELIGAALIDLQIGDVNDDVTVSTTTDAAIIRAVCCYCGYHFELEHGALNRADAFKRSYDEQKAQLSMNATYGNYQTV